MPSFLRQNSSWSYKQAIMVRILRAFLNNVSQVEMKTPLSLKPGKEGMSILTFHKRILCDIVSSHFAMLTEKPPASNFAVMKPAATSKYIGVAACDAEIKPTEIGGTWYPSPPSSSSQTGDVILHFHGGAYVIGDGRYADAGFAAKTLLGNTSATHVFCPQYRLASNLNCRFPAQLQDAITSFLYLTETLSIPTEKIIISGDSAGANLCLSLLRYIVDNKEASIPNLVCAFLWSPWVDPAASLLPGYFDAAPNSRTDYVTNGFGAWGAKCLSPSKESGLSLGHENINFKGTAFYTPTPLFFSAGESEALYHDILIVEGQFRAVEGNKTEMQVERNAVHDIILVGDKVGFEAEARLGVSRAWKFWEGCR
jgi:acetyl esterase/lipase